MKENEIRIGNCVNFIEVSPSPFLVHGIHVMPRQMPYVVAKTDQSNLTQILSSGLTPIELTKQWLLDFGFNESPNGCWHIGQNPITYDWLFFLVWHDEFAFYRNAHHPIKYVHQLQNLYFAINGQELMFLNA